MSLNAIVTGASRGLGRALAVELARAGSKVVLVARESEDLHAAVAEIRAAGGTAHAVAADLGDKQAIHAIAGAAAALVGPIDLLVHNASALGPTPLKLLLDHSQRLLRRGAIGIFPKGQDVDAELTEAAKYWNMDAALVPSVTDSKGRIVIIRRLQPQVVKA